MFDSGGPLEIAGLIIGVPLAAWLALRPPSERWNAPLALVALAGVPAYALVRTL